MGPDAQTDKWDVGTARLAATFWLIFARPVKVPAVQTVTHFYVDDIYKIEEERLWYECRQQLLIPAVILLRPPLFFFFIVHAFIHFNKAFTWVLFAARED